MMLQVLICRQVHYPWVCGVNHRPCVFPFQSTRDHNHQMILGWTGGQQEASVSVSSYRLALKSTTCFMPQTDTKFRSRFASVAFTLVSLSCWALSLSTKLSLAMLC
jgi:hypothetical protein